jgi:hypothetical protein
LCGYIFISEQSNYTVTVKIELDSDSSSVITNTLNASKDEIDFLQGIIKKIVKSCIKIYLEDLDEWGLEILKMDIETGKLQNNMREWLITRGVSPPEEMKISLQDITKQEGNATFDIFIKNVYHLPTSK